MVNLQKWELPLVSTKKNQRDLTFGENWLFLFLFLCTNENNYLLCVIGKNQCSNKRLISVSDRKRLQRLKKCQAKPKARWR